MVSQCFLKKRVQSYEYILTMIHLNILKIFNIL